MNNVPKVHTPTPGAVRAAAIIDKLADSLAISRDTPNEEWMAKVIDRETGGRELLEHLKTAVSSAETLRERLYKSVLYSATLTTRNPAADYERAKNHAFQFDALLNDARAAIARCEGKTL